MGRQGKGPRAQEAAPPKQLDGYAFNIYGWAMEIPAEILEMTRRPMYINAYEKSTTPWDKAAAAITNKGEVVWRESLALTPRELDDSGEAGIQRYLLVGFTHSELKADHSQLHRSLRKQKAPGVDLLPDALIKFDTHPLMVVAQMQEKLPTKVDLFVLLHPKLGLCKPYHIGLDKCFYLPLFRNWNSDKKTRAAGWNQIVAKHALLPSDNTLSTKQELYKKARETTKVVLEPRVSLRNEITCLTECFVRTGEMWFFKEISSIAEQADLDLQHMPPPSNAGIRKFVDNDEELEEGDTARMVEELSKLWPDLGEIDATDLASLKDQLVQQEIVIEYRLLRPFIAEASYQIRTVRETGSDGSLQGVAKNSITTVRRVLGSSESTAPILSPSEQATVLRAILTALEDIVKAAKDFEKGMKDSLGDQTFTGTMHDIWDKFAGALDTDAAKLSWFQASRYLATAKKHEGRGVVDMIMDVVEIIKELKLGS